MNSGTACAKIILFGEHAVVYGKPGIALPVLDLLTRIDIEASKELKIGTEAELPSNGIEKLEQMARLVLDELGMPHSFKVKLRSDIPIGSGLGSSASLSIAFIHAVLNYNHLILDTDQINALAFECEKIFHGTPSGIDNTVISNELPVFFRAGNFELLKIQDELCFVIADTCIRSDTKKAVSDFRKRYDSNKKEIDGYMDDIASISEEGKRCLETGDKAGLGKLMSRNHEILKKMQLSCPELDKLVDIAMKNGAYGAKLAGSGLGGNIIALIDKDNEKIIEALKKESRFVHTTTVK